MEGGGEVHLKEILPAAWSEGDSIGAGRGSWCGSPGRDVAQNFKKKMFGVCGGLTPDEKGQTEYSERHGKLRGEDEPKGRAIKGAAGPIFKG